MKQQPDSDKNKQLKILLALKHHEQPPPGYFDQLPSAIIHRLKTEQTSRISFSWFENFFAKLAIEPKLAYGVGLMVGASVILGGSYFVQTKPVDTAANPAANPSGSQPEEENEDGNWIRSPRITDSPRAAFVQTTHLFTNSPVRSLAPPSFLFEGPSLQMHAVSYKTQAH
jgi:hypothetical protein